MRLNPYSYAKGDKDENEWHVIQNQFYMLVWRIERRMEKAGPWLGGPNNRYILKSLKIYISMNVILYYLYAKNLV